LSSRSAASGAELVRQRAAENVSAIWRAANFSLPAACLTCTTIGPPRAYADGMTRPAFPDPERRVAAPILSQGNRPVRALTRAATRGRRRTQRPATQNSGRHHTRTSHAAPTVGPRITRRCDDRLNSPIPIRPMSQLGCRRAERQGDLSESGRRRVKRVPDACDQQDEGIASRRAWSSICLLRIMGAKLGRPPGRGPGRVARSRPA